VWGRSPPPTPPGTGTLMVDIEKGPRLIGYFNLDIKLIICELSASGS